MKNYKLVNKIKTYFCYVVDILYLLLITIILKIIISKNCKKNLNRKALILEHLSISNIIISIICIKKGYQLYIFKLNSDLNSSLKSYFFNFIYGIIGARKIYIDSNVSNSIEVLEKYIFEGDVINFWNRMNNTTGFDDAESLYDIIVNENINNLSNFIGFYNESKIHYDLIIVPEFFRVPYASIARYLDSKNQSVHVIDFDRKHPFAKLKIIKNSSILPEM